MINKEELNLSDELLRRKTFSIPSVQKELGIGYKELRNCVRELEKNGQATLSDDGLNYIVDNSRLVAQQLNQAAKPSAKRPSQFIQPYGKSDKDDDDDEKSPFDEMIARRRRELMERFAELMMTTMTMMKKTKKMKKTMMMKMMKMTTSPVRARKLCVAAANNMSVLFGLKKKPQMMTKMTTTS